MAHSDHHLFAHLAHRGRARAAIRAAEVPALHFRRYLGGCLVTVRGGKGCDKSNTGVPFKRRLRRDGDSILGTEEHHHHHFFFLTVLPLGEASWKALQPISSNLPFVYSWWWQASF